jgi:hypothetical protein
MLLNVFWRTIRQATITQATCEAELIASSFAARELIGMRNLVQEIFPHLTIHLVMYGDNQAANLIANCQAGVRKVRHLDLASLYVREVTENGTIKVRYVESTMNLADILTKILPEKQVKEMLGKLCLQVSV